MKRGFIGAGAEEHPRDSGIAIISQLFQLIGNRESEVLALVLQHAAQKLAGWRVRLEWRVQRATTELAVARPSPRYYDWYFPVSESTTVAEILAVESPMSEIGRESAGLFGFGRQKRERFGGIVEGETIVHQLCTVKPEKIWSSERIGLAEDENICHLDRALWSFNEALCFGASLVYVFLNVCALLD